MRVWGREHVVHGKAKKRPRPKDVLLRSRAALAPVGPSTLQLEDFVNNPKKDIGSMKISGTLGAERLNESQHKGRHHVSFQLDLSCHHMVCTQMHSKIKKQVNNTHQKMGPTPQPSVEMSGKM